MLNKLSLYEITNNVKFPLIIAHFIVIIIFWFINSKLFADNTQKHFETEFKTQHEVFYYTIVSHLTIGFGDVYPLTTTAKNITILHGLIAFFLTSLLVF